MTADGRFDRRQWLVVPIEVSAAKTFVETHHYARGMSHTAVYSFGLVHRAVPEWLFGVTTWLPPTKPTAASVNPKWQRVLSLSRMAVDPRVCKNACSFMLGKAVRHIRREGRFDSLVTFADESQGHDGLVYRASNWQYVGRTTPTPRWIDPTTGRQVATLSTRTRTKAEMLALGYVMTGKFAKHKYVLHLR
jgi:hypothetical protein